MLQVGRDTNAIRSDQESTGCARVDMMAVATFIRALRCRFRWCEGHVVSGIHDNVIWIGWQCDECGAVKYYSPDKRL